MTSRRKTVTTKAELVSVEKEALPATPDQQTKAVVKAMREQHPIYGAFGMVFDKIGGVEGLAEWAEDNPTDFYRIFSRMVPADNTGSGQINIQINNQLGPSPLDG